MGRYWRRCLGVETTFVFDTNVFVYAGESWREGYRKAREWTPVGGEFRISACRRRLAEAMSRYLFDLCKSGYIECLVPDTVPQEIRLTREPRLRSEMESILREANIRVEETSKRYKPEDVIYLVSPEHREEIRKFIESCRHRAKKLGISMTSDPYLILLARERNGVLVTGDKRLARIARLVGVKVLYIMDSRQVIEEFDGELSRLIRLVKRQQAIHSHIHI